MHVDDPKLTGMKKLLGAMDLKMRRGKSIAATDLEISRRYHERA